MSEKCDQCGCEVDMDLSFACEGAMANERSQTNGDVDTTLLPSCYCCDKCRAICLESYIDQENEDQLNQKEAK